MRSPPRVRSPARVGAPGHDPAADGGAADGEGGEREQGERGDDRTDEGRAGEAGGGLQSGPSCLRQVGSQPKRVRDAALDLTLPAGSGP